MNKLRALTALLFLALPNASHAEDRAMHLRLVFVDFYDDDLTIQANGHILWSGKLTVEHDNETTGLSLVKEVTLPRCSVLSVHSKQFSTHKWVCLTNKTTFIYINAKAKPHISMSEKDVLELD